jgi:hypothetical protein
MRGVFFSFKEKAGPSRGCGKKQDRLVDVDIGGAVRFGLREARRFKQCCIPLLKKML